MAKNNPATQKAYMKRWLEGRTPLPPWMGSKLERSMAEEDRQRFLNPAREHAVVYGGQGYVYPSDPEK